MLLLWNRALPTPHMHLLLLLLPYFCFIIIAFPLAGADINRQRDALLWLRSALNDEAGHLSGWNAANDDLTPCKWAGISCDPSSDMVVSLDLSSKNLSGHVSAAIAHLTTLVNVSLASNNFSGPFPSQITRLRHLRHINISNNLFSGFFPADFSRLHDLQVLDAFNNNFTGELPLLLGPRLRHLHLGGNYFAGTIPSVYGNLVGLQYLALSGNALTGRVPPELGNLTNLERLYLGYYNQFDGGIPAELGRLTNLVRLDMADSGLSGYIPPALGCLVNLDSLFLQANNLIGPIPPELGNLTRIKSLDLSNNRLTGTIPASLANLHNLELLNLFLNSLYASVPSYIAHLPNLQVLTLWENNFTGIVPQHLGVNAQLLELDLSSNSFTGPIPPDLCTGGKLRRLILLQNQFTGPIPEAMGLCSSLVRVRLGENRLAGSIPVGLLALPELELLEAPYNYLSGQIPQRMPSPLATKLGSLDLSHNQLTGTLPSGIGKLSQLVVIDLSANLISGRIPDEIGHLKRLAKLDLSGNVMIGRIPQSIGQCSSLASLDLSRNRFQGMIPPQLAALHVLASLNLSRNHFVGEIPLLLQNLVTLTVADFSFNDLSIPMTFNQTPIVAGPHNISRTLRKPPLSHSRPVIYGTSGLVVGMFMLTLAALFFFFRNERDKRFLCSLFKLAAVHVLPQGWKLTAFERLQFSASDVLSCMTEENVIGKGGAGIVYKGTMADGKTIAIKRLPAKETKDGDDDYGFSAEIATLGTIRHRNIVRLLGCCSDYQGTNLLLYEYMPNGSLGELLHGHGSSSGGGGSILDWPSRCRIALEAARGLSYLHHDCHPVIVHRDVKSNNILLDSNYEAHVADFGLARALRSSGKSESVSSVVGSYGYIAPEYAYTLKINEKSDIYSFGVVLLELLTGRMPMEPKFGDCVHIARWVKKELQARSREGAWEMVDERMGVKVGTTEMQEVMQFLVVALRCLADVPEKRPAMREVVQLLSDIGRGKESTIRLPWLHLDDHMAPASR